MYLDWILPVFDKKMIDIDDFKRIRFMQIFERKRIV